MREQVLQTGEGEFRAKGGHAKALGEARPVWTRESSGKGGRQSEAGSIVADEVRDTEEGAVPGPAGLAGAQLTL